MSTTSRVASHPPDGVLTGSRSNNLISVHVIARKVIASDIISTAWAVHRIRHIMPAFMNIGINASTIQVFQMTRTVHTG